MSNDGRRNNKPPAEHQFKKGRSGNPRGRPKKRPREFSQDQLFRDVLHVSAMKVKVDLGQGKKEFTMQEAMIIRMFTKGVNGDNGMIKAAIPLLMDAHYRNRVHNRAAFEGIERIMEKFNLYPILKEIGNWDEILDGYREQTKPI